MDWCDVNQSGLFIGIYSCQFANAPVNVIDMSPIERQHWKCPGCSRTFNIPASAELPTLCPECQNAGVPVADDPLKFLQKRDDEVRPLHKSRNHRQPLVTVAAILIIAGIASASWWVTRSWQTPPKLTVYGELPKAAAAAPIEPPQTAPPDSPIPVAQGKPAPDLPDHNGPRKEPPKEPGKDTDEKLPAPPKLPVVSKLPAPKQPASVLRIDTPQKKARFELLDSAMQTAILNLAANIDGTGGGDIMTWHPLIAHPEFFDNELIRKWLIDDAKKEGFDRISRNVAIPEIKLDDAMVAFGYLFAPEKEQAVLVAEQIKKAGGIANLDEDMKKFVRRHRAIFGID